MSDPDGPIDPEPEPVTPDPEPPTPDTPVPDEPEPEPTYPIYCSGPGPHDPPDGILGESTVENAPGFLCVLCAALLVEEPPEEPDDPYLEQNYVLRGSPRDPAPLRERPDA